MSGDVDLIGASIVDDLGQYKYVEKSEQLGDLEVKTLACHTGGPGFNSWVGNPKFWILSKIPAGCHLDERLNCWSLVPVSILGE